MTDKPKPKTFKSGDIFHVDELRAAIKLYETHGPGSRLHAELRDLVDPIMPRINATTGQENDADYMAYVLEYIASRAV